VGNTLQSEQNGSNYWDLFIPQALLLPSGQRISPKHIISNKRAQAGKQKKYNIARKLYYKHFPFLMIS